MAANVNSTALINLPWLPRLSDDFRTQLKAIDADSGDWGKSLRRVANQHWGLNQAMSLAKAVEKLHASRGASPSLTKFRLALVSNATTDFIKPFLIASALRYGIALELITPDFGQITQQALDPNSTINRAAPDAVLLSIDHRGLPFRQSEAQWPLFDGSAAISEIAAISDGFRRNCGAVSLVQTLPGPHLQLFGSLDATLSATLRGSIAAFNVDLARAAAQRGDLLLDIEWLANCIGLDQWYDERQWYLSRVPCSAGALPIYADFVCRSIAALRGKARKCLVLDLDNTVWGGVIGDDGLEGIAVSPGDPRGEAHRAVQQAAKDLRARGVVLAVCSKNNEDIARSAFQQHTDMILKESDIAVFIANWDDKATNLERIAKHLELGIDSLVFIDDNPVERAQVRQVLPEVAIPEIGEDPSAFARILMSAGYFESVAFTNEDVARADQYKSNADRSRALEGSRNMTEFLQSLAMEIVFVPFSAQGRKRITQLINKTNQFNLTTRRYTEQQVIAVETSAQHYSLQVSVRDKFGDNGMIGVVICDKRADEWEIDSWLMSCRVLNRGVEQAICNRIAQDAKQAGARRVIGKYIPTARNVIVNDLYQRLGFVADGMDGDAQRWVLDIDAYAPHEVFFKEITTE